MAELDTLEVKIQANATKAVNSVEKLAKKLDTLSTSIGKLDSNGINKFANGMTNLANGMNAIRNVKLPDFTRTAKGLKQFENINTAKLRSIANTATPLANGLNAIANVQFNNSGLTNFVNALTRLSNSNIGNLNVGVFGQVGNAIVGMSNQLQNAQQVSTNVIQLTNAIARLAGAGQNAVTVTNVLPAFANVLRNLFAVMSQAPMVATETTAFTTALGNLAVAGNKVTATATGLPALATALRSFFTTMSQAPTVSRNTIQMTQALAQLAAQGSKVGSATRNISSSMKSMGASAKFAKPHIKSLTSQLAGLYARVWVVIRAFSWFKKAIDISSDLTEVNNVVVNTFGQYSDQLEKFSKDAITNYGISELAAKETASRFQAMGITMGAPVKNMANMSMELTKLSADLASFYNVDQSDAARSLWSVFTGETEPMRKFGLDLTEASLKAYALKNGLDSNISSMTQFEKTLLRYQYVLENTKNVQGDFARTSQNWANQLRILQQLVIKIAGVWGNAFVNMLKPLVQALNKALIAVYSFSEKVVNALGAIFGWKLEIQRSSIDDDFSSAADDANNLASGTKKAAKAAKDLKTHLLGIDELNVVEPDNDTGNDGAGGSGGGASGSGAGSDNGLKYKVTETEGAFKSNIKNLEQLGKSISDSLSNALESINWKKIYKKAKNFGKGFADFLNGLITPRLFYDLGSTIGNSINTALTSANAFAVTFDWKNLGKSLVSSLTGFLNSWDAGLTGKTLSNFVIGICQSIVSAVQTMSEDKIWQKFGQKIVDFICGIDWGKLIWNLGSLVVTLAKEIPKVPYKLLEGVGQAIIDKIFGDGTYDNLSSQKWFATIKKVLGYVISPLTLISDIVSKIKDKAGKLSPYIDKLKTKAEPEISTIANILGTIHGTVTGVASVVVSKLSPVLKTVLTILSPIVNLLKAVNSVVHALIGNWLTQKIAETSALVSTVWEKIKPILVSLVARLKTMWEYIKKIADKISGVAEFAVKSSPITGASAWINQKFNIDTTTNGKSDKDYKKLNKSIRGAVGLFKDADADYNVTTEVNGNEAKNIETIKNISKQWRDIWQDKDAKYDVKTATNGQTTSGNGILAGILGRWSATWKDKSAKFSVDTAVNGNKTTNSESVKNIMSQLSAAWKGKTAKFNATTSVNGTATTSASPLKKISDSFMSVFNGKSVTYNVKTQSNSDLQVLGKNAATQIYAGMSQKEIGFKIKQQTQADGGTALDRLLKGTYSLNFQQYAQGGFPEDGWFRASHGEYMGKFDNGQSVVYNNEQITSGIAMGVREAVSATLAPYLAEIAQNTRETADKDFTANIDGRSLVSEVDRRRTRNGYSFT